MSNPPASSPASLQAAIAAHRFGLGEASLNVVTGDPRVRLAAQIGPADTMSKGSARGLVGAFERDAWRWRRQLHRARTARRRVPTWSRPSSGARSV